MSGGTIGIDLGTANTLVCTRHGGIIIREPSYVTYDTRTNRVLSVGNEAKAMYGKTPPYVCAMRPLRDGVIADLELTGEMLRVFIRKALGNSIFASRPNIIICIPYGVTDVERKAVEEATLEAGAGSVSLIEEPMAAAIGAGLPIRAACGCMVVDIGGGTTEIAVVSMGGVAECESIKTAGSTFDEAIIRYIKKKHNMLIGAMTAEEVKINIGGVYPRSDVPESMEVKGRDLIKGLPKTVSVTAEELVDVLREPALLILENVHAVLERTPPELIGDLGVNGMILSGGGSMLYGIDRMLEDSTHIRTMIVDDPLACAAHGAGKLLTKLDTMQDGMMNFLRNREMRN